MTTKHNTKHPDRKRSNYPLRLAARGLSKSPRLEELEVLERRQIRREIETGAPWFVAFTDSAAVVVKDAEPNPKAEALLRDIFGASVPDDGLVWDSASHSYQYAPYHPLYTEGSN